VFSSLTRPADRSGVVRDHWEPTGVLWVCHADAINKATTEEEARAEIRIAARCSVTLGRERLREFALGADAWRIGA